MIFWEADRVGVVTTVTVTKKVISFEIVTKKKKVVAFR